MSEEFYLEQNDLGEYRLVRQLGVDKIQTQGLGPSCYAQNLKYAKAKLQEWKQKLAREAKRNNWKRVNE